MQNANREKSKLNRYSIESLKNLSASFRLLSRYIIRIDILLLVSVQVRQTTGDNSLLLYYRVIQIQKTRKSLVFLKINEKKQDTKYVNTNQIGINVIKYVIPILNYLIKNWIQTIEIRNVQLNWLLGETKKVRQ